MRRDASEKQEPHTVMWGITKVLVQDGSNKGHAQLRVASHMEPLTPGASTVLPTPET